jgi:hypothetical protein
MMIIAGELPAEKLAIARYDDDSQPFATLLQRHPLLDKMDTGCSTGKIPHHEMMRREELLKTSTGDNLF